MKMSADISTKLHAKLLVVTKKRSDFYSLRWGFANKGYRNFDFVFDADGPGSHLERSTPDAILISSGCDSRFAFVIPGEGWSVPLRVTS